jgi:hypothetical protein
MIHLVPQDDTKADQALALRELGRAARARFGPVLKLSSLAVYASLHDHADSDWRITAPLETVGAGAGGVLVPAIRRALAELSHCGLIELVKVYNPGLGPGGGWDRFYVQLLPPARWRRQVAPVKGGQHAGS